MAKRKTTKKKSSKKAKASNCYESVEMIPADLKEEIVFWYSKGLTPVDLAIRMRIKKTLIEQVLEHDGHHATKAGYLFGEDNVISNPKKRRFLQAFSCSANMPESAIMAGVCPRTVYGWIAKDKAFAVAMEDARELAIADLEGIVYGRALDGVAEPVTYRGEVIISPMDIRDHLGNLIAEKDKPLLKIHYDRKLVLFLLKEWELLDDK